MSGTQTSSSHDETVPAEPPRPARVLPPPNDPRIANRPKRTSRLLPVLSAFSLVAVVVAWWLLTDVTETIAPLKFPSIGAAVDVVRQLGTELLQAMWATTWRVLLSWGIGCTTGIAFGLVIGRSKVTYAIFNPLIEALRPIPPIAMIPFVILWFGLGESGRILLGALACFMTMVVLTHTVARNVPPVYLRAARSLGASENAVYRTVVLRAIVPNLVGGIRISAALTWAVIVGAEYLGAQTGVGFLLLQASRTLNTPVVLVGTIVIGLLAFLLEQVIRVVARRLTSWAEASDS